MTTKQIKAIVSGKVQRVWFRANTQKKAIELGLTGQAINLANGNVEVIACGEQAGIEQLIAWLHIGSEKAVVDKVEVEELESVETFTDFTTG